MSGPKGISYYLVPAAVAAVSVTAKATVSAAVAAERARRQLAEEMEKRRLQKIEEEIDKRCQAIDEESAEMQKMLSSTNRLMEQEKKREQEREEQQKAQKKEVVETREQVVNSQDIRKTTAFQEVLEEARKHTDVPEESNEELEAFVQELMQERLEKHSLIDSYKVMPQEEAETKSTDEQEFEELLVKMEEEYQQIIKDRAFFKYDKARILKFEEICKRQQEYRSYKILREVYFGEFNKIKKARDKWHQTYDSWKESFEEAYIEYRAICQILGRKPAHYYLNVDTVQADIEEMKQNTIELQEEHLRIQESLEITRIFNEVMDEMGYQVLATKDIAKKSGGKVQNTVFSYGEGSGIHVMDSGSRITMEIVGLDDGNGEITEEDKEYLEEEQVHFCESFKEIEEELAKRGVVVKQRIRMLPPSKEYSTIMDMEGYTMTEHKKETKSLSKVDKKAKRKQQGKKYMSEQ